MAPERLADRADALRESVNALVADRQGDALETELRVALQSLQDAVRKLGAAVSGLEALEQPLTESLVVVERARGEAESILSAVDSDAVACARSQEGRNLPSVLGEATAAIDGEVQGVWSTVRNQLCAPIPLSYVAAMARIPALAADAHLILQSWRVVTTVQQRRDVPSHTELAQVREARAKVDSGLSRMNEKIPTSVRSTLQEAVEGTLRLADVTSELLKWIEERELDDLFRVSVR